MPFGLRCSGMALAVNSSNASASVDGGDHLSCRSGCIYSKTFQTLINAIIVKNAEAANKRTSLLQSNGSRYRLSKNAPSVHKHSEGTFDVNSKLGMIVIVVILSTLRAFVGCCHVKRIHISGVPIQAKPRTKKPGTFQHFVKI